MKQLTIIQIEKPLGGAIQIKMHKLSSDGDVLGIHRTTVAPGGDVDAQVAAVNTGMAHDGYAPMSADDVAWIKREAAATWTPENIAPVTQAVTEAIAVQQAAITEAAAKKAEAEAAAAKEIEDAKVRETAANEAKATAEAAEQAAKAAEASAKAAADAAEKENARLAQALAVAEAAAKAAADKQAFDDAVAAAVREAA